MTQRFSEYVPTAGMVPSRDQLFSHRFCSLLRRAELPRAAHGDWLWQEYLIHAELDGYVSAVANDNGMVKYLLGPARRNMDRWSNAVRALDGRDFAPPPLAATCQVNDRICAYSSQSASCFIGAAYALDYISDALADMSKAYRSGIEPAGDDYWDTFNHDLNTLVGSRAIDIEMPTAVVAIFGLVEKLWDEILASHGQRGAQRAGSLGDDDRTSAHASEGG
jgi:hypothetical protein